MGCSVGQRPAVAGCCCTWFSAFSFSCGTPLLSSAEEEVFIISFHFWFPPCPKGKIRITVLQCTMHTRAEAWEMGVGDKFPM